MFFSRVDFFERGRGEEGNWVKGGFSTSSGTFFKGKGFLEGAVSRWAFSKVLFERGGFFDGMAFLEGFEE